MNINTIRALKSSLVSVILIGMLGCSTVTRVSTVTMQTAGISPGQKVSVDKLSGQSVSLIVEQVSAESIAGRDDDGSRLEIQASDINQIEVKKFSPLKTAGATVLSLAAALLFAADQGLISVGLSM